MLSDCDHESVLYLLKINVYVIGIKRVRNTFYRSTYVMLQCINFWLAKYFKCLLWCCPSDKSLNYIFIRVCIYTVYYFGITLNFWLWQNFENEK